MERVALPHHRGNARARDLLAGAAGNRLRALARKDRRQRRIDRFERRELDDAGFGLRRRRRSGLNQIALIPAARAPITSAAHESPTITTSSARRPSRSSAISKDPRIRLRHSRFLRHHQLVDEPIEPALPQLALLFLEQVVRHDADLARAPSRQREARLRPLSPGELHVPAAIRSAAPATTSSPGVTPTAANSRRKRSRAGLFERQLSRCHANVQLLEEARVQPFDLLERAAPKRVRYASCSVVSAVRAHSRDGRRACRRDRRGPRRISTLPCRSARGHVDTTGHYTNALRRRDAPICKLG